MDRGSTDDNFNHFLPTNFNAVAKDLVTLPLAHRMYVDAERGCLA